MVSRGLAWAPDPNTEREAVFGGLSLVFTLWKPWGTCQYSLPSS